MKIRKYIPQHSVLTNEDIVLARFWPRAGAMMIDLTIVGFILDEVVKIVSRFGIHLNEVSMSGFHVIVKADGLNEGLLDLIEFGFTLIPLLYFALFIYFTNGKTIGKYITRIRVVSLYHHHISFWHCIERSLGYAASTLEAGLGFLQIFWNPNRMCLHDRIAETVVIQEKKKEKKKKQAPL